MLSMTCIIRYSLYSFAVSLPTFTASLGTLVFATYSGFCELRFSSYNEVLVDEDGRWPVYLIGTPLLTLGSNSCDLVVQRS